MHALPGYEGRANMNIILSGTKEIIFDTATELFASDGYDAVGIREIAAKAKVNEATIYYYFTSKNHILDTIYDYYLDHFYENRIPFSRMKKLMETADASEIILGLFYTFNDGDEKKAKRMLLTARIIYMRIFHDKRANHIFNAVMSASGYDFVQDVLKYGVAIGRIRKNFDIETFSKMLVDSLNILALKGFAGSKSTEETVPDYSIRFLKLLAGILPLSPPRWNNF